MKSLRYIQSVMCIFTMAIMLTGVFSCSDDEKNVEEILPPTITKVCVWNEGSQEWTIPEAGQMVRIGSPLRIEGTNMDKTIAVYINGGQVAGFQAGVDAIELVIPEIPVDEGEVKEVNLNLVRVVNKAGAATCTAEDFQFFGKLISVSGLSLTENGGRTWTMVEEALIGSRIRIEGDGLKTIKELQMNGMYIDLAKATINDDALIVDIPEDMQDEAELYHTELVEKICELDDDLMMEYLEGEEPSVEAMKAALRKGTCECTAVPVCCGSAYKNKGVQKLLDAILEFMPAPTDIPPINGTDLDGNEVVRHSSDDEPFSALVFKIMTDPFVGKLAYFRVYSGTMNSGSYVLNATKDKKERVGRILQMHANKRQELDKVYSGDIAAAIGFKFSTTGDTICDEQHPVILESMEFPEPVIELAIEPKTKAGQGKLGEALAKLAEEDPTFRAHTDQETGQTIIAGMGELHLDIIVDRLLREFKVEANVGAPQVAYKETITKPVDVEHKYAKQSGGRGQYGHCKVKFEPMDANAEETYKFESTVVGGAIPKEYIPAVGEGIEDAMKSGILGGFPVVGVHANVYDGSYHEVDSSEMAFHIAGSLAFKDAMQKAAPVLLEPIMKVEVTTPEDYMGDVIGDINSRRGRIEGMEDIGGGKMIRGYVPLSEMFGYATDLRSRTQGRGNYSMFFEKYEQVPKSVQEKILSKKD